MSNYIVIVGPGDIGDQCGTPCTLDTKFQETRWDPFQLGDTYYTDRDYTITGTDPQPLDFETPLEIVSIIKNPNDERNNTQSSGYMRFTIGYIDIGVYLAFDSRLTSLPDWVLASGFQKENKYVYTSLSTQPSMQLYRKFYSAGECVDLGGNRASGASGGTASNYVVFIVYIRTS